MSRTAAELKLDRLTARRENLFRRVQICFDAGESLKADINNATEKENFKIRYGSFTHTAVAYRDIIQEIIITKQEIKPSETPDYGIIDAFEDLCDRIEYMAKEFLNSNPVLPSNNNSNSGCDKSNLRMPKIELMKFDGDDLTLWPLFYENFKQFVHGKSELSKAEKLQYLLGSLTGKALKICNKVEAIPDNYEVIWKLLEDTYHDKRFLASLYLDRLLNYRNSPSNNLSSLQNFLEKFDTNVTALKRLKLINLEDYIITYIAMSKLSQETVTTFELVRSSQDLPTYEELLEFVRRQSKIIFKSDKSRPNHTSNVTSCNTPKTTKTFVTNESKFYRNCIACNKGSHLLKDCQVFKDNSHEQKFKLVKDQNLCLNCFSSKHKVMSCASKFRCIKCKAKHHTLLHRAHDIDHAHKIDSPSTNLNINQTIKDSQPIENNQTLCTRINSTETKKAHVILLSTALVKVVDKWNKTQTLRFLIDNGSMSNLLTFECCKKLGLPYFKLLSSVIGIGGTTTPLKGRSNLTIHSNINPNIKLSVEVLLIDQITNMLPDVQIDAESIDHIKYLPLADPTFAIPGEVHGVLGAAVFAEILGSHRVSGSPTAVQTALGYIMLGSAPTLNNVRPDAVNCTFLSLNSLVEQMWQLEDYSPPVPMKEDAICENLFQSSVCRDSNGRYTVALPFKDDPSKLGSSHLLAEKRLFSLERRLEKSPNLREIYSSIIQDYLNQGHMTLIENEAKNISSYYIPHHCVFKSHSFSTPCRIVFDCSMKTDNGISLNDILFTGPKLQNNLFDILLNFRLHPIAMTADIKQMYRQINIVESHRPYQRILWRFNTTDPISIYQLNTITFGVRSSPFLSLRSIKQLAEDESESYPKAVVYVNRDMYMDDLICSLPNVREAIDVHYQLVNLFHSGGFQMVKWISNSEELLSQIPEHLKLPETIEFDKTDFRILGLQWNPITDMFSFKIKFSPMTCTKRSMLSLVARTFDPCGYLAPITLFVKLLIKQLWELNLDWDQPAPKAIEDLWIKFQNEFEVLNSLQIPRHLSIFEDVSLDIVGFCDASTNGYASVVYVRTESLTGQVNVTFLCARSKVAPMTKVTLPRLELCAAVLLAKLIAHVRDQYSPRKSIDHIYAFSDSMITLHWLQSSPKKWKTFISNRVTKIQSCLPSPHWHFVSGKQNAADCASRGFTPTVLMNHDTWFSGPSWLLLPKAEWPIRSFSENIIEINDTENQVFIVTKEIVSPLYKLITYFSSWTRLINATVYVLRFAKILPHHDRITKSDIEKAELMLVNAVQQRHFKEEYKFLAENKTLNSNLRRLNPFCQDNIIRVGGRLSNANVSFDHKHPILLPKSDPFVDLLVDYTHQKYSHTSAHLLQSLLRQNYWILSARDIIRKRIWKCNHCFRLHPKPNFPMMADLPSERVNQAKAFLSTGVDYTGAFHITLSRRRGIKTQKAYVCLFICLATKAVHLELAADLSTDAFLAALKRFLSRRGNCATIFSDCGTNFLGAKNQLSEIQDLIASTEFKNSFQQELNTYRIDWKFNVPSGPHFGGIWEANIKSVKSHLSKVVGSQILSYEEFYTVLTQIEAILNSRPLCYLSNDPRDPVALTPAHFLYATPLNSFPSEDVSSQPSNRLARYKLLDSMVQHYWKRWHVEYLNTLQVRQKWNTDANPAKIGLVVVVIQENISPLQWPLAIIEKLHPGKDGVARVATIKTKNSSFLRPIVKLCPLPNQ